MGSFIISLDCEGKWGMADHLEPYLQTNLTDVALASVYDHFVGLFARYELPATFAYVMAFTLTGPERARLGHLLAKEKRSGDSWLSHHWADLDRGNVEGWFQPHALDAVTADGRHEIACHGFCHRPLNEAAISQEEAEAELDAAQTVAEMKGVSLKTFIFPRNMVGHLPVLQRKGYIGYRALLERPAGKLGRAARLAEEFNIWAQPQPPEKPNPGEMVRIPAGYFFNWRWGSRRRVPPGVTVRRWRNLIDRAAEGGGVAHLWLHPHNLITGPETRATLESVLAYAAKLRDQGKIKVVTQERYCSDVLASAA